VSAAVSVLELIEESASGGGTVQFLPEDRAARPISELWDASARSSGWVQDHAGTDGTVAVVASTCFGFASALFGAWRAGATVGSLQTPGRGVSVERYREQVEWACAQLQPACLLVDPVYRLMIEELELPVPVFTFDESMSGDASRPDAGSQGRFVQFTSGTTAQAAGVELSLEAIASHTLAILSAIAPREHPTSLSWLPLSHDMGLIGMFLTSIVAGSARRLNAHLVLLRPEDFLRDPRVWLQACSEFGAEVTAAPLFALELATRRMPSSRLDLSRMRTCTLGGEVNRAEAFRRFESAYAEHGLSTTALCPAYGLAEATLAVTLLPPDRPWASTRVDGDALARGIRAPCADGDDGAREIVMNGPTLPGVEVRVRGAAPGDIGRIEISSPSLLRRYIGRELELTDDGWFATADLGFMDGDQLAVIGRLDDVLVVGGRNINAGDVERVVDAHAAVRLGSCIAVPTDDGKYAVLMEPAHADSVSGDLRDAASEIRAAVVRDIGVAPRALMFVKRGTLPKTPSGKKQRWRAAEGMARGELEMLGGLARD
jgi:acyl-CoA synthetase (AMP-forming)/AMP-acid ligase II